MQINIKDFIENFSHVSSSKDYLRVEKGKFSCSILKGGLKTKEISKFCHHCLEKLDQKNLSTLDKLDLAKKLSSSMKSYAIRFHQSYSHRWLYKVLSIFGYKVKLPFEFIRDKQSIDSLVNTLQTRLEHSIQQRPLVEHKISISNKYQKQLKKSEDPLFVGVQVMFDGLRLKQSRKDLRNDPDIALEAIKNNIGAYEFIGDELKKKPDFLIEYFLSDRFDPKGFYEISQSFPELKEHFFKFIQESSEIYLFKKYLRALPSNVQGLEFALFLSLLEEPHLSNFTIWFLEFIVFTYLADPLKEKIYPKIEEFFFGSIDKIQEKLVQQGLVKSLEDAPITPASVRMIFFCVIKKINSPALDEKIKNNQKLFFNSLFTELVMDQFILLNDKHNLLSFSNEIITFALAYNQTAFITKLLAKFNFWRIYPMVEVLDKFQQLDIFTSYFETISINQQNEIMKALARHNKNKYFDLCNFLFDKYHSNPEKFPFLFLKVIIPLTVFEEKQGEELINLSNETKVKYHHILNKLSPIKLNDYFCESGQGKANYEFIEKFGFINDKNRFENRSLYLIFFDLTKDQQMSLIHQLDIDRLFLLYCFCRSNHDTYDYPYFHHVNCTFLVPQYLSQHPEKLVELLSRESIEFPNLMTEFTLTIFETMSESGTLEQFMKDNASNSLILKHCFSAALRDEQWLKEWILLCKILKKASFADWDWVYDLDAMKPFICCGQNELITLIGSLPDEVVNNDRSAWIKAKCHHILNQLSNKRLNDYFCYSGQGKANYEFIEKFGFINDKNRFENRSLYLIFFRLTKDQQMSLIHQLDIDRLFLLHCYCVWRRGVIWEYFSSLFSQYLSQHPEKLIEFLTLESIEYLTWNSTLESTEYLTWNSDEKTGFTLYIFKMMHESGTLEQFIKDNASNPLILKQCFGAALTDKQWLEEWTLLCKILKEASFADWDWVYDVVDATKPLILCGQKELITLISSLPEEVVNDDRFTWIFDRWIKKWSVALSKVDINQID